MLEVASVTAQILKSDIELLLGAVSELPVSSEEVEIQLGYLVNPEISVEAAQDIINRAATRATVSADAVIEGVKNAYADNGDFVCQCIVVKSQALSDLQSEVAESFMTEDIELEDLGVRYHIPLSESESEDAIDIGSIVGQSVTIEALKYVTKEVAVQSSVREVIDESAFFITDDHNACEGIALVRTEDNVLLGCYETEIEAREAKEVAETDQARESVKGLVRYAALSIDRIQKERSSASVEMVSERAERLDMADTTETDPVLDQLTEELLAYLVKLDKAVEIRNEEIEVPEMPMGSEEDCGACQPLEEGEEPCCDDCADEHHLSSEDPAGTHDDPVQIIVKDTELAHHDDEEASEDLDPRMLSAQAQQRVLASREPDFRGIIVLEGAQTGDRRFISQESLSFRDLPLPLMYLPANLGEGHKGSVVAGVWTNMWRTDHDGYSAIWGEGIFHSNEAGQAAKNDLELGMMRGISVDLDSVKHEIEFGEEEDDARMIVYEGRIMGATFLPMPAFQEAGIWALEFEREDDELVASGAKPYAPEFSVVTELDMSEMAGE